MILLYPILFFVLILIVYKNHRKLKLSLIILIAYFISSIFSFYLKEFSTIYKYSDYSISFHSVIYLFLLLSIIIYGFIKIEQQLDFPIPIYDYKKVKIWLYLIIVISFLSIYDAFLKIQLNNFMNVEEIRYKYNEQSLQFTSSNVIFNYLFPIVNFLYPIVIFLFLYSLIFYKNKLIAFLLLISSLATVFHNISIVGRDAAVRWIFMFIVNLILFFPYMKKRTKIELFSFSLVLFISNFLIILYITIERFKAFNFQKIFDVMIDYYSQGFLNFSLYFDFFGSGTFFGRRTFPIFFPANEAISGFNMERVIGYTGFQLNVFSTIVGSIYQDFGYILTIFIVLLFYLFFAFISKIKINHIAYYFMVLLLVEILFSGLFFFMHWSPMIQKIILIFVLFLTYKKYSGKKSL